MDMKINGLKNFSNISVVNKIAQNNKQNTLKQSLLSHLLFIMFNLIIYTTKEPNSESIYLRVQFIFVSTCVPNRLSGMSNNLFYNMYTKEFLNCYIYIQKDRCLYL